MSAGETPAGPRAPRPGGDGPDGTRERFHRLTLATRDDAQARATLDAEWRYLGPLLEGRPAGSLAVLDLACGSGWQTLPWAERGGRVHGVDLDHALLVAGRERLARARVAAGGPGARVTWTCADAARLPYRAASFDVVFNNSLLEHVPAWRAVLAEVARVLRPGGVFAMYTTNRASPRQQEVNHFPFYSWLPDPVQRRVLAWIMAHRRDLVNFTDYPAVNWFTFPGMERAFRAVGLQPFDRLDLIAGGAGGGLRRAVARAAHRHRALKWPYYLYAVSMALYGVKR